MQGDAAVGYYTTAYKFIDGLNIIPSFFTLAVFPIFARYAASSTESLQYGFRLSLKALLIISVPITVLTTLMAEHIILTFFGEPFAPAALALQALIWFLPFSYVNSVTHYVLIAVNQQRFLTLAFLIGVAFNVVTNLVMIPWYGYLGAAITTVMSEIVLMIPFFYAVRARLGRLPSPLLVVRPAVAAAVMGAVVVAVSPLAPWPIVAALAPLVYLPALLLVGGLDASDLAVARRLFLRPDRTSAESAASPLAS
ncbi:MAG: polysaccharide biosynthesis C-terminal domain-containing protein, partial [Dehalococcoidia bacterium]|nr:polysaccharide biosynthesis C-terminal domain-containing protein [Dehalococcoidia bacterium]